MMGRQVNFWLSVKDQTDLESIVLSKGSFAVLNSHSSAPELLMKERLERIHPDHKVERFHLVPKALSGEIVWDHNKHNDTYDPDLGRSPVVQYNPCRIEGSSIFQGRFYFQARYVDDLGQLVEKHATFNKIGDSLLRLVRKNLNHLHSGFYAGNEALKLKDAGFQFRP
ncbi:MULTISPECIES: hypothetical protein [unclassified Mesorhizobium]|uniref:hypothetical protein n=1 Tax=unclassified Mesorhizobium TaxID=325217 RepID=UPI000BAE9D06|nr:MULTISPECIES: hypothetical protein [unclassified Mesorhizobium]PBB26991.1 hypothetical protein CK232_08090 [Mesorhizobium sp. WSM4304]PBB76595.1 hypothetical protein CK227_03785 [Mesorhizobium sp. WSM4308]PBC22690.1 hypothetical protein CK226_12765 [Mesorhizobium sp. WSM4311]TRD08140.1 hypothetical protein FJV82_05580 [Mesorhizobium sp. WSM4305]